MLHSFKWFKCIFTILAVCCIAITGLTVLSATGSTISSDNTSPFAIHGVLEGFYGEPWTHEERLDIIRFTSRFGMQSYLYAPKDDPYHRARWRDSYSGEALHRFEEMMKVAKEVNVEIWYAISPGLDMVYSSEEDYQALMNKMEAMIELGVRNVALFVDDVPESLIHDPDKEKFNNLAEAHVHVGNRLYNDLNQRGIRLAICPTTYTNAWGDRAYIKILGERLSSDVPIFWTGPDVVTGEITSGQAKEWGAKMQRAPLIWDNFPVNDFDTNRVFLGPVEGRDSQLASYTLGILANPMNQAYASMIPLATLSYYVADPDNYDPDQALERALHELYPASAIPHIREIVRLYRQPAWEDHIFAPVYRPGLPGHVATIDQGLSDFEEHFRKLKQLPDKPTHLAGLVRELEPFLTQTRQDWQTMKNDPSNVIDDQGMLRMRLDQQVLLARRAPDEITIDGHLDEWILEGFYSMNTNVAKPYRQPELAVVYDDTHLYLGLRVYRTGPLSLPERFFNGDHIAAIFNLDPESGNFWVEPQDPVILMRPYSDQQTRHAGIQQDQSGTGSKIIPDTEIDVYIDPGTMQGDMEIRALNMTDYTRIGFANNPRYTFSWFYLNQAGFPGLEQTVHFAEEVSYAWQITDYGYSMELAVPHYDQKQIRAAVGGTVTTWKDTLEPTVYSFILSRRPFFGNTATYPVIRLID
jgi:hypothetical protein